VSCNKIIATIILQCVADSNMLEIRPGLHNGDTTCWGSGLVCTMVTSKHPSKQRFFVLKKIASVNVHFDCVSLINDAAKGQFNNWQFEQPN